MKTGQSASGSKAGKATDAERETYQFYRLCHIDLDAALHTLGVLSRYRRRDVRYCLLRDLVVTYARPFSGNRGRIKKTHRLPEEFVPTAYRDLHDELIDLRDRLFAHSDFSYLNPRLVKWTYPTQTVFPLGFSQADYTKLDRRVKEIRSLVEGIMQKLATEIKQREAHL